MSSKIEISKRKRLANNAVDFVSQAEDCVAFDNGSIYGDVSRDESNSYGYRLYCEVLSDLVNELGITISDRWLSGLHYSGVGDSRLVLVAENRLIKEFVLANYFDEMLRCLKRLSSSLKGISILVKNSDTVKSLSEFKGVENVRQIDRVGSVDNSTLDFENKKASYRKESFCSSPLNSNFLFENFVKSSTNEVAYNMLKKIAASYSVNTEGSDDLSCDVKLLRSDSTEGVSKFNLGYKAISSTDNSNALFDDDKSSYDRCIHYIKSFYLFGAHGMGKTHLLHALVHQIKQYMLSSSGKFGNVLYFSAEQFTQQYVYSIRNNLLSDFKHYVSGVDLLIIDDFQLICGRQSTEKEFITAFDSLVERGKRVIIGADRSPNELEIHDRGRSRLNGSMILDIKKPDYLSRLKILEQKAKSLKIFNEIKCKASMKHDLLELIALSIDTNVRELESVLQKVIVHCSLLNREISMDIAHEIIQSYHMVDSFKDFKDDSMSNIVNSRARDRMQKVVRKSNASDPVNIKKVKSGCNAVGSAVVQQDGVDGIYEKSNDILKQVSSFNLLHEINVKNAKLMVREVASYFSTSAEDLCSSKRGKRIAIMREIAVALLKENTTMSLKEIGEVLGGRKHSTIIHILKSFKVHMSLETNDKMRMQYLMIKQKLVKLKLTNF